MHSANLYHVPAHGAGPWGPHGKVFPSWQGAHCGVEGTSEVWQGTESGSGGKEGGRPGVPEDFTEESLTAAQTSLGAVPTGYGAVSPRVSAPLSPPFPLVCLSSFLSGVLGSLSKKGPGIPGPRLSCYS